MRCRPKAPWRNFPTGKGVAPLRRLQGRAGGGGEERGHPYAKARVQHALYCYFARSFTNVACGFALTHAVPSPLTKFATDPPSSKIFAKQCEGEGGNCGENCGGRSAENCYRGREGEFPSSIRNQVPVKPYFVTLENHFHENAILPESVQLSQSKQVPYLGHEDD